jgi:hypothetical protein
MAISATLALSNAVNFSGAGGGAQNMGTLSVTADEVYLAIVHGNMWDDSTGIPTAIAGPGGLTFTLRGQTAIVDGYSRLSVWTGKAASTASGNATVTINSTWDGAVVNFFHLGGVKTTGTNGADCIKSGQIASTVGAKPTTATLGSAITAGNLAMAFGGAYNNSATPETCTADYATELYDSGVGLPDTGTYSMYLSSYISADASDNAPTLNWSGTGATAYGVLVIELDAAGASGQTITPGVLAATIASPTLAPGNVNVAPGVQAATIASPTLTAGNVNLAPSVQSATLATPALSPGGVSIAAAVLGATIATPSLSAAQVVTPAVLAATIAAPTLVPSGVAVLPGVLVAALATPSLLAGNANVTPGVLVTTIASPTLTSSVNLAPGVLAATLATPTLQSNFTLVPGAVSASIASPNLSSNFTLLPGSFAAALFSPSLLGASAVSPDLLSAFLATPALVPGGISVAPALLAALLATPTLAAGGVSATPGALVAPALAAPTIFSDSAVSPAVLQALLASPSLQGQATVAPTALTAAVLVAALTTSTTVTAALLVAGALPAPSLLASFTLAPAALLAAVLAPSIEGQSTLNPPTLEALLQAPTFGLGGVSLAPAAQLAVLATPTLASGGASIVPAALQALLATPMFALGAAAVTPGALAVGAPFTPSLGVAGSTIDAGALNAVILSASLVPGGVSITAAVLLGTGPFLPGLVVGAVSLTPTVVVASAPQPDVFLGGEVALPDVMRSTLPLPTLAPGGVSITAGVLRTFLYQPTLSNYYDDLPIPEDVNPGEVGLVIESFKVRSLDVDFNELSWRVANTLEDIFDFTLQVLRSEGPEGPYRPISPEFQDKYLFVDNDVKYMHRDRQYYYKISVKKVSSGATRVYGPVYKAPDADLIAVELRKHMALLSREFIGRSCWVFPVRTFGSRCRECYQPHLQSKTKSHCLTCYDTGFVGGYLQPIETWISIDPTTKATQNTNVGPMQQRSTTARLPWWPPLKEGDLIIEPENRRWRVTTVTGTEQVRAVVHQEIGLHEVQSSDMEYRVPLKLDAALRDLWLMPARNMSNPHDLTSFTNEDYPDVLQLYGTSYPKKQS